MQGFLARDEGKWVGGSAALQAAHAEKNRVDVTVSASSHVSWMEGAKVARAQRELVMALVEVLRDLNLEFCEESLRALKKEGGGGGAGDAESSGSVKLGGGAPVRLPLSAIRE